MQFKKSSLLYPIFFIILPFYSCHTGYKKENGTWVWVSYDESAGRRTNAKYGADKNNVYFKTRKIKPANPKTFSIINDEGYSKDDKNVFLESDEVLLADPRSFEIIEFPYSKDKNHVFCGTLPIQVPQNEINEFKVTTSDKVMSGSRSTILKKYFIKYNPGYTWLDTLNAERVIVNEYATAATGKRKFKRFREVKN